MISDRAAPGYEWKRIQEISYSTKQRASQCGEAHKFSQHVSRSASRSLGRGELFDRRLLWCDHLQPCLWYRTIVPA